VRKDKVAPPQPAIFKYLPSLAPPKEDDAEPLIAAHRGTIIWTLNDMLAKLSAAQTNMQEERAKRRDERNRTLGGGAAREAAQLQIAAERSGGSGNGPMPAPAAALNITPADEPAIEEQLSAHQLQQFESENNALLEHMESQLSSVLAAERSLLEISAMQTELVRHLVQQTEIIDRLYDEAVGSVSEMGAANKQLKRAKERSGEARLMLLVFLIGATFSLLFLNWYS
jgi:syntaxin 18